MSPKFFARSYQSAIARFFLTALLLVSLTCPAVHAQILFRTATTLALSQARTVASGTTETLTAAPTRLVAGTILLGQGNGNFTLSTYDVGTGVNPDAIAVGDLNNDGILDLVVADYGDGTAIELLGNGDGTFGAATLPVGRSPEGVVIADFNRDGRPDIATANSKGAGLTVLLQQAGGTFASQGS